MVNNFNSTRSKDITFSYIEKKTLFNTFWIKFRLFALVAISEMCDIERIRLISTFKFTQISHFSCTFAVTILLNKFYLCRNGTPRPYSQSLFSGLNFHSFRKHVFEHVEKVGEVFLKFIFNLLSLIYQMYRFYFLNIQSTSSFLYFRFVHVHTGQHSDQRPYIRILMKTQPKMVSLHTLLCSDLMLCM